MHHEPPARTAPARNAALRAAARAAFPGIRLRITSNGERAGVYWTDGPPTRELMRVLRAVPANTLSSSWPMRERRAVTALLCAVGYLRLAASGEWFYDEKLRGTGEPVPPGQAPEDRDVLSHWSAIVDDIDGTTVSDDERRAALLVLTLAGVDDPQLDVNRRAKRRFDNPDEARRIARAVYHHAHIVTAVLT